jgi:hypothetical protein
MCARLTHSLYDESLGIIFQCGTLAVERPSFVIGAPARMAFSLVALVIVMNDPACGGHFQLVPYRLSGHAATGS